MSGRQNNFGRMCCGEACALREVVVCKVLFGKCDLVNGERLYCSWLSGYVFSGCVERIFIIARVEVD